MSDDWDLPIVPCIDVEIMDPVVTAVLFGPDGEPLVLVYDKESIPFGFQPAAGLPGE